MWTLKQHNKENRFSVITKSVERRFLFDASFLMQLMNVGIPRHASNLSSLFKSIYKEIQQRKQYNTCSSEMFNMCNNYVSGFSYIPGCKPDGVMLYFHGLGGLGLWNVEFMRRLFPRMIILFPSNGVTSRLHASQAIFDWCQKTLRGLNVRMKTERFSVACLSQGVTALEDFHDYYYDCISDGWLFSTCPEDGRLTGSYPLCVISGEDDWCFDAETLECWCARREAWAGQPTLVRILPDTGHFAVLQRPTLVRSYVRQMSRKLLIA